MRCTLIVTTTGQVTLQREVLDHLGVVQCGKIIVDFLSSGRAEIRAETAPATEGTIGSPGPVTVPSPAIGEMDERVLPGSWADAG
jgi:hypothetical protein